MLFEKLQESPYAWTILAICTIVSVILAIWTLVKGRKKLEFSCFETSNEIVEKGESLIADLQLLYKGKAIDNITFTKYAIWNSGTEVINCSDIVSSKPLQIGIRPDNPESVEILDAVIIKQSEESNGFEISEINNDHINFQFDYAGRKDGIVVQIVHTGGAASLKIDCKIKGGKELKHINHMKKRDKISSKKFKKIASGFMGFISSFTVASCVAEILVINDLIPIDFLFVSISEKYFRIVSSVVLMALLSILIYLIFKLVILVYHLDVPLSLRNGLELENELNQQ